MYTRATSAEATLDTSSGMRARGGHPDHGASSVFNHDIGSVRRLIFISNYLLIKYFVRIRCQNVDRMIDQFH